LTIAPALNDQSAPRCAIVGSEPFRLEGSDDLLHRTKERADTLYVQPDPSFTTNRVLINTLALSGRLPTMHGTREHVDAGGLISYGTSLTDMFRRAGDLVDKILRGTKPADIPVEQPAMIHLFLSRGFHSKPNPTAPIYLRHDSLGRVVGTDQDRVLHRPGAPRAGRESCASLQEESLPFGLLDAPLP
jgi:hypothetical protein